MRQLLPAGVAFCVMAGLLLGRFVGVVAPVNHLTRPFVVVVALTVVVGMICLFVPRHAAFTAAALGALLVAPVLWGLLVISIVAGVLLAERMTGQSWNLAQAVAVMATVFLLSGVVRVAPLIPFGGVAHASKPADEPPTYVVLLDGYPRIDSLAELGIDNTGFVTQLEQRGFDHYPEAYTDRVWTFDVLTAMLGNGPEVGFADPSMSRPIRDQWRLPAGWVTISSPAGHTQIPHVDDLSPGGINYFELGLLADSILGHIPGTGTLVMNGLRQRLDRDLEALASTEHSHVFAHLMAPHAPLLYGSDGQSLPAPRWPSRDIVSVGHPDVDGLRGTLDYLNGQLIEVVDRIIDQEPNTVIVLFSDHGIRFSETPTPEWYRTFHVARTPGDVTPALAPATTQNR